MDRLTRRRFTNGVATTICLAFTAAAVWPLFSVLWKVFERGHGVVDWDFLTTLAKPPFLPGGGIKHAIVGTGMVVGIGTLIGAPIGVMAGIYLAEYGNGRFARTVRIIADALTGVPSILAGLFGYVLVVTRYGFSAYAGGVALAFLMMPVVTRTTEEALRAVPHSYREAAIALGAPRWRTILTVVVPAGGNLVLTGILLSVARIAGETAPLLLTVLTSFFLVTDPMQPVATLPYLIYDYGKSAYPHRVNDAWGAALVLITGILLLNILVRLLSRRTRRGRWNDN